MSPHALLDRLKQRSHFVQGQRVALDKDVAELYGVSVGKLRGAVKRHLARFPPDFLLEEHNQYFFSEVGILMVSSILRNSRATQVSLAIVRELFGFNSN
jgi:hypothetical protein